MLSEQAIPEPVLRATLVINETRRVRRWNLMFALKEYVHVT